MKNGLNCLQKKKQIPSVFTSYIQTFRVVTSWGHRERRKGKVGVGSMLVARKHTKAAGTEETNSPTLLPRWFSEGSPSPGWKLAAASSSVSRQDNGV